MPLPFHPSRLISAPAFTELSASLKVIESPNLKLTPDLRPREEPVSRKRAGGGSNDVTRGK